MRRIQTIGRQLGRCLSSSVATSHDSPAHVAAVWLGIQSAGEVDDVIMMMVSLQHSATGCILAWYQVVVSIVLS